MPPEFQNCSRKTKKKNLQLFSDCRSGWSKELQWENHYGSFLPCSLLVQVLKYNTFDKYLARIVVYDTTTTSSIFLIIGMVVMMKLRA